MQEFRRRLQNFYRVAYRWCDCIRAQQISLSDNLLSAVISSLEALLQCQELQDVVTEITDCFTLFLTAYEDRDRILAADYMETGILRLLEYVTQQMLAEEPLPQVGEGYELEMTSVSAYTLVRTVEGKRKYLHSNLNPFREAERFTERWMGEGICVYHVVGLGLGYHVESLSRYPYLHVYVYEEDEELISICKKYSAVWPILEKRQNVHILADSGYEQLVRKAQEIEEQKTKEQLCLYHPSLETIRDTRLRENMQTLFLQMDNANRWSNLMKINFSENVKRVPNGEDRLREDFAGKTVYLIAGGPSLDKNIHLLKERGENDLVLTVGTSLRRCIQEEIHPDYAIITDPKEAVYAQIDGIQQSRIPLLLLSTAYLYLARDYEGEKYLLCQEGYEPAEEFAHEQGWQTFETGSSVVTAALDFCIKMGVRRIVFLGLDLAFTGGRSHQGVKEKNMTAESELYVTDIDGNEIATSRNLHQYRLWIERKIAWAKQEKLPIEFIDASEGGARVEGTVVQTLLRTMSES